MPETSNATYEFGPFRLDVGRRVLTHEGERVAVTAKAFDVLLALVERPGEVVDKDQLLRRIWPDTVVEEKNLTVQIATLRKALGESPQEHRFVVTVPGRGYQFVAPLRLLSEASPGGEAVATAGARRRWSKAGWLWMW